MNIKKGEEMLRKTHLLYCSMFALAAGLQPAYAQDAASAADEQQSASDSGIGDIVVTAQRRAESMQKVPIAVTAVTGAELDARGITDILSLRESAPSLNVASNAGFINPYLRGIGSNAGGPGVENPIAVYLDGVYVGTTTGVFLEFSNIKQVEVLKGPQGTLFGRNATGGLIQAITKDPTQELSGEFRFTYANYDTVKGQAYISGGLTDTLRGDIAVQYSNQGKGWGKNLFLNKDVYADKDNLGIRSKWIFEPSSETKFTLIGDYSQRTINPEGVMVPGTTNGVWTNILQSPPPVLTGYDTYSDGSVKTRMRGGGVSLRWDQDIGDLHFVSLSAYRYNRWALAADLDFSPVPVVFIQPTQVDNQFSQELQLLSSPDGPLTWMIGAYFFYSKGEYAPLDVNLPLGDPATGLPPAVLRTTSSQKANSIAGFAQATYAITPTTKLTLGGRYTSEKRSLVGATNIYLLPDKTTNIGTAAGPYDESRRFNKFTFRIALDQQLTPDILAYASFNRGFKSGGFNAGLPPPDVLSYTPETLDAYEIGLKSDIGGIARLNLSAFYYDYKNLQVQELFFGTINVVNGGAAKLYGGEAEFEARITPDLTYNASVALLHTEFTDFPNAPLGTPGGGPLLTGSAKGNQLPFAPKVTLNMGLNYRFDLAGGDMRLNGNIYHSSGWYGAVDNLVRQKPFERINLSATWNDASDHFRIGGWVKNLNDVRVQTYQSVLSDGTQYVSWAEPRTYGVTAGYKF